MTPTATDARRKGDRSTGAGRAAGVCAVAVMLLAGACGGGGGPGAEPPGTAPASARVDRATPTFSNPTSITNPLFPVSTVTQVIQLGEDDGEPARVEVTLLPEVRRIDWEGRQIETRVSQFVAFIDGRIVEDAVDFFAQDDAGNVWYFGEEVNNYDKGVLADHKGSWLAGRDGPPGMIMPAEPRPGDAYRPENIPGVVFEEVTVQRIDQTLDGPRGPVTGAVLVRELLMEGTTEDKLFAPGYGEFRIETEDELLNVALAVPTDAAAAAPSSPADGLSLAAAALFDAVPSDASGDWVGLDGRVDATTGAVDAFRAGRRVSPLLDEQMAAALEELRDADGERDPAGARQAAAGVLEAALDFELYHRPVAEVDLDRLGLWARRIVADSAAGDAVGVYGDVASLGAVHTRVRHAAGGTGGDSLVEQLDRIRKAVGDKDPSAAARAVPGFLRVLDGLTAQP